MSITDEMSLGAAREELRRAVRHGATCPLCRQFAKVYRRKLNAGITRALIVMYRAAGTRFCHKPTVLAGLGAAARDESIARFWGLLEEEVERRPDGGRSGWWRVTEKGEQWILGAITVPSHALIYDSRCLKLEGDPLGVRRALGSRFDYDELMRA